MLVVDDDPRLRELIRISLEPEGYTVAEAGSAEEALEDGPITEDERELLEALRKKLGLSARDCREIEAEIRKPAS